MNRRRILGGVAGVVVAGGLAINMAIGDVASVFTGGAARLLCTAVFAADRDPELAREQDFGRLTSPGKYLGVARTSVNLEEELVTASLFGWKSRTAVHREGLGCTVADGGVSVEDLLAQSPGVPITVPEPDPSVLWPEGAATLVDDVPVGIDRAAFEAAVNAAFVDTDPERPKKTRAVVVVHQGRIIGEGYADGFDEDTVHLSNSVAKSLTATLIGVLVAQGRIDIHDPAPIDEWHSEGDPRANITTHDLLQMSSGLEFEESYSKIKSDITMMYVGGDLAGYAADKPLEADPGDKWSYSTGTANILGRIVRQVASDDLATALAFPRRALFDPLGMRHAVLEADTVGNFVGGSSAHLTAREYARLGLLHLQDGVWNGQRILPEGWVDYVTTPVADSDPEFPYGGQFWLNWDGQSEERRHPELPDDAYFMNGHQGQHVVIIPTLDLIVVRTGLSEFGSWDIGEYVARIIQTLPA